MFNYRGVSSSKCSDKYENGRQAQLGMGLLSTFLSLEQRLQQRRIGRKQSGILPTTPPPIFGPLQEQ